MIFSVYSIYYIKETHHSYLIILFRDLSQKVGVRVLYLVVGSEKMASRGDELIRAADYDKVMGFVQESSHTSLQILARVALFSELEREEPFETEATDPISKKICQRRPCIGNEQETALEKETLAKEDHPESSNINPRRNPAANPRNGGPPLREIPVFLRKIMDGLNVSEPLLVVEKTLTMSDVNSVLSRLQIPESQMNQFLSDDEIDYLKIKVGPRMNGIDALLHHQGVKSCSMMTTLQVKRWEMAKKNGSMSIMFVLTTGWNDVVSRTPLRKGDTIQLWSFRVERQLHLGLVVL